MFLASAFLCIGACSSKQLSTNSADIKPAWILDAMQYKDSLNPQSNDSFNSTLRISQAMRDIVQQRFGHLSKRRAAQALAKWLIAPDGHGMKYDVTANFSPIESFRRKRGNCLSFTMLLTGLGAELNIDIQYNEVDLPDIWEFNGANNMVLYRHVNGLLKSNTRRLIFDLAINEYDFAYPQRIISPQLAVAKLHSNRAVEFIISNEIEAALHYMLLAVSIAPDNSELWVNLGVVKKRQKRFQEAEEAFLYAIGMDRGNMIAASNLERLYRNQKREKEANYYGQIAQHARNLNPYFHFENAKEHYKRKEYRKAVKSINRAKRLHDSDARFYELASRISQKQKKYRTALLEIRKAYATSFDDQARGKYAFKAKRVVELLEKRQQERDRISRLGNG